MKKSSVQSRGLSRLAAVAVSLFFTFPPAALMTQASVNAGASRANQTGGVLRPGIKIAEASAEASPNGVLLQWRTSFELGNIGFNVYAARDGQRIRVNNEIILGSTFITGERTPLRAGYSYSCFDAAGTIATKYYIEATSIDGTVSTYGAIAPVRTAKPSTVEKAQSAARNSGSANFESGYPAGSNQIPAATGATQDQWEIAAQPGLKIAIKKAGWYRVTQQQMAAVGFNPVVDIANLQLFNNALELAINTNKPAGQFVSGDYVEFYGKGLDTATTDSNIYYLVAGSSSGRRINPVAKRTRGILRPDSSPAAGSMPQTSGLLPSTEFSPQTWFWWNLPVSNQPSIKQDKVEIVEPAAERVPTSDQSEASALPDNAIPLQPLRFKRINDLPDILATHNDAPAKATFVKHPVRKGKNRRSRKREFAHPATTIASSRTSFDYTVQRKDRIVYFSSLLNGDTENFFGSVLSSAPVDQTLTVLNPETTGGETAHLEFALQGVNFVTHQYSVLWNGTAVGNVSFFGLGHTVQTIDIPASQLTSGVNTMRLVPSPGSGVSIVDYIRLTYPHTYHADNDSLRFTLAPTQTGRVDGFSTSAVRVLDYSDPFSVKLIKPLVELNGASYTIQIPSGEGQSSSPRSLYALPETEFDQSAVLSLNQPSTLNLSSNGADLLIITTSTLSASVAPLASLRTSQGMTVGVVDIDDVFDEFGYGLHDPQAIKVFTSWAAAHWAKTPRYIIFAGDASLDPRNYLGFGNFDLVPTKLVDATFSETASDDWLTDFDNDGTADIPVGRLPVRTPAECNLVISKIVNFAPSNTPQSALLVADAQGDYYFNFEQANTEVQALLPAGMTVQRVDRRLEPSDAQAKADILARFNSGQALVNYSGHGNVDTWTGGGIFTSNDAPTLTNGNKLPFVVVMDCLNGYFQDPVLQGIAEALMRAPNGGAVAAFASSGSTVPDGQHVMSAQLYSLIFGSQPIALGDAIKAAKAATSDIDVRRTWIFFGDPSMKIH